MTTGTCERCTSDNDGGRLCLRCDAWETILGCATRRLKLPVGVISRLVFLCNAEGRLPEEYKQSLNRIQT